MSGSSQNAEVDLSSVNDGKEKGPTGVAHAGALLAFTDAAMSATQEGLVEARAAARAALTPEAWVDACATIAAFNVVDRIADATGIPLDGGMDAMSAEVRSELDLGRFASSANTPGA